MTLISIGNARVDFGATEIFRDISLTVGAGDRWAVVGRNGTGKTTLAVSLAIAAQEAGEKVLALDLDPQGSLAAWGESREADAPHVERVPAAHIATLPQTLKGLGRELPDLVSGQDQLSEVDQLAQMRVVQADKGTGKVDY